MIPLIKSEESRDTDKNSIDYKNEKSKNYTRMKTDSSKDEKEINKIDNDIKKEEDDNKEIEINHSEKEIIWPENEDEENKQIQLALEESEKEAKIMLEKEEEEERQFQLALKESEKYNFINDNIDVNNTLNSKTEEEEFDEEYGICPITQEYMENPVLSPSGNYYEKSAIISWIEKHNTDPLTRENLTVDMLIEDGEYKKQIINYRKKFNK